MLLTRKERGHERQIKVAKCPINRIKLLDIQMNLIKLAQKQKIDGMNRVECVYLSNTTVSCKISAKSTFRRGNTEWNSRLLKQIVPLKNCQ